MIKAYKKDTVLAEEIRATTDKTEGFRIWWLGQSGFLIQYNGKHLLFDPYLSDSLTRKYAETDKPHTRISERVIDPALLENIDLLTSSHNHTDHLDADTLLPIMQNNPDARLVIPEANRAFVVDRLKCDANWPVGLNDAEQINLDPFMIYGVPAAHNTLDKDEAGRLKYMGFIAAFGSYKVYHSGDTLWYDGMEDILKPFAVDVAFLPINGNKPERRVAGNLNYEEAARLGKIIGAGLTIPHHYDLFEFNTEDPDRFVAKATEYGTPHKVLQLGEKLEII